MKYFLHSTNAFQDEKISELFINFGYEGLGLFYTILERIGSQEKPIKTEVLKKQLFVGKRLEKCWKFMHTIGVVSTNNGETFNERILSYSERYKVSSEKNAKRISEWREKQALAKNVTRSESVRNAPKVNRSKVKESKYIHKEIFYPFNSDEFKKLWGNWKEYREVEFKKSFKSIQGEQAALSELSNLSKNEENLAAEIIKQSMAKGWQGLFEIKNSTNGTIKGKQQQGLDNLRQMARDELNAIRAKNS